jgi:hypoxanthine phosphoribosyltransferase
MANAINRVNMKKSWKEFEEDVTVLVEKVREFKPQVIVPSMRGALIPAVLLSETLGVKDVRPISIDRVGEERTLVYDVQGSLKGLRVLLLEDDLPTGKGFLHVKKLFEERGAIVKIAVVYVKPDTTKYADFYGKIMQKLPDLPWKPFRQNDRVLC